MEGHMTTIVRSHVAAALCAIGLAALIPLTGCATSASRAEAQLDLKKARSHLELGIDHLQNGRVALGLRDLLIAESLDPKNARIQYALAEAYTRKGRIEEAEQHLLRVLELYPPYHDARLMLSMLYIHSERYEEAIVQTGILINDPTFPSSWRALTNQGWAKFRLGRIPEARRDLELSLEYKPGYWPTLLNLGILEAQEGHRLEAIGFFTRMIELDPRPDAQAEANYRLAELYVSVGQRERAVDHLVTAVSQAPGGPWGKKSEEYLKLLR
jgi:type IV pilus assembly protein PilF